MKKILAILLAGMMTATVFAGCGGGGNTESGGSGSDTQSSSDDGGAEVKDANLVDVSVFGDEDNISLKEACVELGFLTAERFDEVFHPEQMV